MTAPLRTALAKALAGSVEEAGSWRALAAEIGLTDSTMRRLRIGEGEPTVRTLEAVAAYLEAFTVSELAAMHRQPIPPEPSPRESGAAGGRTRIAAMGNAEARELAKKGRAAQSRPDPRQRDLWRAG